MQAFMQSLQMRWPVAAQSGLSMVTMARAPRLLPRAFTKFISEIFSSSGHPAAVLAAACFRQCRPGGIPLRRCERFGVGGLVGEPARNMLGIAPLPGGDRQRLVGCGADQAIELAGETRPVECGGVFFLDAF